MIPKRIFTIWLNDNPKLPVLVKKCIESQKILNYEHRLITLENTDRDSIYVRECIEAKNWVKASDYLRMYYIWKEGGIFLDADMEILSGKNFDDMLDTRFFTGYEFRGFIANSGCGSEPGHPLLKMYMDLLDRNFKGAGDMVFEPGLRLFCDLLTMSDRDKLGVKIYSTDYFYPYNHVTKEVKITNNTRVYHHYITTWYQDIGIR